MPDLHRTGRFQALGFDFGFDVFSRPLAEHLERLYRPFRVPGPPDHRYVVLDREPSEPRFTIDFDDRPLLSTGDRPRVLDHLIWHVNRQVVETTTDCVLLHASAAEHGGDGIIFPAPMESGKTTTVAGLLRAGLRYVTDEVVAIDLETHLVRPFPRPLSLDEGSWAVLADLRPEVPDGIRPFLGRQWQVDPLSVRAGSVAPVCKPRYLITPKYVRGAVTQLSDMSRSEALLVLAENCFNLADLGTPAFDALIATARASKCYRLVIGDLDEACELVLELVGSRARR